MPFKFAKQSNSGTIQFMNGFIIDKLNDLVKEIIFDFANTATKFMYNGFQDPLQDHAKVMADHSSLQRDDSAHYEYMQGSYGNPIDQTLSAKNYKRREEGVVAPKGLSIQERMKALQDMKNELAESEEEKETKVKNNEETKPGKNVQLPVEEQKTNPDIKTRVANRTFLLRKISSYHETKAIYDAVRRYEGQIESFLRNYLISIASSVTDSGRPETYLFDKIETFPSTRENAARFMSMMKPMIKDIEKILLPDASDLDNKMHSVSPNTYRPYKNISPSEDQKMKLSSFEKEYLKSVVAEIKKTLLHALKK